MAVATIKIKAAANRTARTALHYRSTESKARLAAERDANGEWRIRIMINEVVQIVHPIEWFILSMFILRSDPLSL